MPRLSFQTRFLVIRPTTNNTFTGRHGTSRLSITNTAQNDLNLKMCKDGLIKEKRAPDKGIFEGGERDAHCEGIPYT